MFTAIVRSICSSEHSKNDLPLTIPALFYGIHRDWLRAMRIVHTIENRLTVGHTTMISTLPHSAFTFSAVA
jgi:hypothetical protein